MSDRDRSDDDALDLDLDPIRLAISSWIIRIAMSGVIPW
jgi:hypothetical protein